MISGAGTLNGAGFDPTRELGPSARSQQVESTKFSLTFSAGTTAVPDGRSAVALLGIALAGVEVLRRKLKAASF